MRRFLWVGALLGLAACPLEFPEVYESGSNSQPDAAVADAVTDRSSADLPRDAGSEDSAAADTAVDDSAVADTAGHDSAVADTAVNDSAVEDATRLDTGAGDSASSDQTSADSASPDTPSGG